MFLLQSSGRQNAVGLSNETLQMRKAVEKYFPSNIAKLCLVRIYHWKDFNRITAEMTTIYHKDLIFVK